MDSKPAQSGLFSLTYVSSASNLFSTRELTDILRVSQRNNTSDGVTGMLVYRKGNFMQVLEGPEEAVRRVHLRIAVDPRHVGLITLLEGPIPHRQFGEWSMGFRDLADPSLPGTPGFNEFLNTPLSGGEFLTNPSRAQKLLLKFKEKM